MPTLILDQFASLYGTCTKVQVRCVFIFNICLESNIMNSVLLLLSLSHIDAI